jgi:uncharacterized protein YceK
MKLIALLLATAALTGCATVNDLSKALGGFVTPSKAPARTLVKPPVRTLKRK